MTRANEGGFEARSLQRVRTLIIRGTGINDSITKNFIIKKLVCRGQPVRLFRADPMSDIFFSISDDIGSDIF